MEKTHEDRIKKGERQLAPQRPRQQPQKSRGTNAGETQSLFSQEDGVTRECRHQVSAFLVNTDTSITPYPPAPIVKPRFDILL